MKEKILEKIRSVIPNLVSLFYWVTLLIFWYMIGRTKGQLDILEKVSDKIMFGGI